MEKYTKVFKHNSGVQSNAPFHKVWLTATPESHPDLFDVTHIVVSEDRIFIKKPRHYTGVINRLAAGGKWEEITDKIKRHGFTTIHQYLIASNAVHANFRGSPRIKQ